MGTRSRLPEGRGEAPDVGLRRVEWVRLLVGPQHLWAEAVGIGHRLPATTRVSLRTATRLLDAGAPLVVRHVTSDSMPGGAARRGPGEG